MQIPRLHPDTVEEVRQRADIYDVVSEYVVLRKRGKDYVGLCPFHDEKSPSFTVSPNKQMYYCFGCQAAGNSIKFMMDLQKRSFSEVVLDLARRYQISIQTLAPEQRQELERQISLREQLHQVLALSAQFYQHALKNSGGALEYLRSKRKLSDEIIQQFGLGYAPAGWETLYRYLVEDKRYPVQLVEKAGLIKPRKEGSGYYDVFRDRIMIPIRDIMGRVIAFGGRTMGDEQPKYLNSPETELFSKGKNLFGLDAAKNGISQFDSVVVVEGYFDAIALHAAGINNAVASLGTALSIEQVKLALRYTESKQLVLNFDADKAGTSAAERAIGEIADLAYRGEVQLKILNIPDGKDADEYLHTHTSEEYKQLLTQAPLWLDWQIQQTIKDKDLKQATDYQQASQQIVKLLKNIVNPDTRTYYITYCAEILSLGNAQLVPLRIENLVTQIASLFTAPTKNPINRISTPSINKDTSGASKPATTSVLEKAEALLLRIFLHCPGQRQHIVDIIDKHDLQFSYSHHRFLWQKILRVLEEVSDDYDYNVVSKLQDACLEYPEETVSVSHMFHLTPITKTDILRSPQVIQTAVAYIEIAMCEKRMQYYKQLWQEIDPQVEPERHDYYYQVYYEEKMKLRELEKQRQFSILDL
ncbi:DNA primase [Calothrix sp. NIES-4071]|nr:DNA primase [Calothrix sp. NIES-4071]BAZ61077.1 DNA primase [Calothrix sp. NIES-4105]